MDMKRFENHGFAWGRAARGRDTTPFLAALGIFAMGYLGLAISIFPMVVPYTFDLWQAAATPKSQAFVMFRGKVKAGSGYH